MMLSVSRTTESFAVGIRLKRRLEVLAGFCAPAQTARKSRQKKSMRPESVNFQDLDAVVKMPLFNEEREDKL